MKIKIDGKEIVVKDPNKTLVDIGDENGVTILAPCHRNKKKHGCCNVCVVEIDGKQEYACNKKPQDGMDIIYNREDLDTLRKERLAKYTDAIKSGDTSSNSCGGTDPANSDSISSSCGTSAGSSCGCSSSSC